MQTQRNWTVPELRAAMLVDLQSCHTALERSLCRAVCESEIRMLQEQQEAKRPA